METSTIYRHFELLCFLFLSTGKVFARRSFATIQACSGSTLICNNCGGASQGNAVDCNLQKCSTLNVAFSVLARTYQELIFLTTGKIPTYTPVTIKQGSVDNPLVSTISYSNRQGY
jgi:hypothetical protein